MEPPFRTQAGLRQAADLLNMVEDLDPVFFQRLRRKPVAEQLEMIAQEMGVTRADGEAKGAHAFRMRKEWDGGAPDPKDPSKLRVKRRGRR